MVINHKMTNKNERSTTLKSNPILKIPEVKSIITEKISNK